MASDKEFDSCPKLPYWTKVRTPLFEIIATLKNRIDRDLGAELNARCPGTRVWLLTHIRVAEKTWEVVEALAHERRQLKLDLDISVTIPPLVRVIGDSLFTVFFVFEDLKSRLPWFWKSTWREICEQHKELSAAYGDRPDWVEYLNGLAAERDKWRDQLLREGAPLSSEELADPSRIKYWPNPGKMLRDTRDPDRVATLSHLNVRYYGPLSGASHLSGIGIMGQSTWLAANDDAKRMHFSNQVLNGLTLLFCLLSQLTLDVVKDPALARRVVALWQTQSLWDRAVETYDRCFKAKLEGLAAQ